MSRACAMLIASLVLIAGLVETASAGKQIKPKVGSKWSGKFKSHENSIESAAVSFKIVAKHGKRYAKGKATLHTGCFTGDSGVETAGPTRIYHFKAKIKSGSFLWKQKASAGTGEEISGFFKSDKKAQVNIQADDGGCGFDNTVGGTVKRK